MKKIIVGIALAFILIACTNAERDTHTVNDADTSVIGSDNPNPMPDTTGDFSKMDSIKNK